MNITHEDNPCVKTGAWMWLEEYNQGVWCDLYRVGNVLIARVISGQTSDVEKDKLTLWATMHEVRHEFMDRFGRTDRINTLFSTKYTMHRKLEYTGDGFDIVEYEERVG